MSGSVYVLAIIGGGINGAGVARDAALRGLRVALFEREDWGAGTTGSSTRMIHGGVRYLLYDVPTTRVSSEDAGRILAPDVDGALTLDEWGCDVFRLAALNALDAREAGAHLPHEVVGLIRSGRDAEEVLRGL